MFVPINPIQLPPHEFRVRKIDQFLMWGRNIGMGGGKVCYIHNVSTNVITGLL